MKSVLSSLIGKFMNAGTIKNGIFDEVDIVCPQGGGISLLLMYIHIDHCDNTMMEIGKCITSQPC
ncbi:hypothetical protein [Clostridium lacusfryxellense]|uniref:hypothetical protein n=1 Tax=Clostridium lacusfryxellense TaxID=205328 RepID=UPI001C0BFBFC|nr:hypothetical protein [Clostridium lacusfryxellense]MBU3111836.1 hypothetical protein [Clostridium lacusfryxellense]